MNKQHFIRTSDEHTANLLRKAGFVELPKESGMWVFVNNNKIVFSSDGAKITYSDVITF